ncbi:class I SAM-dependent methyltransferase [Actinospica durhamensis]|uniref:Class I SAM-dependent methyltransferase n=2 Tax=Actinospica durhamensis TaxID=1508375 RepID=A0A941ESZ2_9ACTN|nr:class I SAM-dependent methyltransferase [Actinospica durhamensis]
MQLEDVQQQYQTTDLLRIRVETHQRYTEQPLDLDQACTNVLGLTGDEALLDVGCGPGAFLRHLRAQGHRGRLAGLDQSRAMVAEAAERSQATGSSDADPLEWFQGLADALPFADGEFSALSARHMLYHVPDVPAALRSFARVVVPGGVVLAVTNGVRNTPGLADLEDALATEFGLEHSPDTARPFNAGNAAEQLRAVFPVVEEAVLTSALVFTDPGPIVDYVMTLSVAQQAADDPELFRRVHAWLTGQATRELAARGGTWRDPKSVGLYRCTSPGPVCAR